MMQMMRVGDVDAGVNDAYDVDTQILYMMQMMRVGDVDDLDDLDDEGS